MALAMYSTLWELIPAIEILPFFTKWMWCFSIRLFTCGSLSPVYENIPIWSVMWFHVPVLKPKITWSLEFFEFSSQSWSHLDDSVGDFVKFILPLLKVGCVGEDSFDDSSTVDWWAWVVGSDNHFKLTEDSWGGFLVLSDNVEGSYSFTVHTHVFGIWLWDKHAESLFGKVSDGPWVLDDVTWCESLISWIEVRNKVSLLHDFSNFLPVILSGINTSRVVGSSVHQNHITGLGLGFKTFKVVVDLGLSVGWIVVRILIELKAGSVDDVVVVGPGWVRNPNQWWELLVNELKSDSEWTSATQCLHCDNSAWFNCFTVLPKDQSLRVGVETSDTVNGNVLLKVTFKFLPCLKRDRW